MLHTMLRVGNLERPINFIPKCWAKSTAPTDSLVENLFGCSCGMAMKAIIPYWN